MSTTWGKMLVKHSFKKMLHRSAFDGTEDRTWWKITHISESKETVIQTCWSVNVRKFYEYRNKFILLISFLGIHKNEL